MNDEAEHMALYREAIARDKRRDDQRERIIDAGATAYGMLVYVAPPVAILVVWLLAELGVL